MRPFISIIVKPTLACNMRCRHCYQSEGELSSEGRMSYATLERLISLASREYESVWFIWHGGEPLLMGVDFLKKAMSLQDKYFGKDSHRVINTVQTNGLLADKKFMSFCKDRKINVGVSYEGSMDSVLREKGDEVSENIDMMVKRGFAFSVSCTIAEGVEGSMTDLYGEFAARGINASFSPVACVGCTRPETVPDPRAYAEASIRTFDRWLTDSGSETALIPHYLYILSALGEPQESYCAHSSCLTKWLSIYPDGTLYPCGKSCPEDYCLCNISDVKNLSDAFRTEGFRKILIGSVERREKCKLCVIYDNCNGGCSIDAHFEGGIENNGNPSCEIYKAVFTHVKGAVDAIMEEKPDLSDYNRYVRDAIVGKLVNPKVKGQ